MFVEWSTEDHSCDAFRLDTLDVNVNGICEWRPINSKSTTRSEPSLIFKVFFAPRVHWKTIYMTVKSSPITTLESCHSDDKSIVIDFEYRTVAAFNQQLGSHLEVHLSHIRLNLTHHEVTLAEFHRYEDHKVSLLLRVLRRENTMVIRSVYVGRAQEIQTTEHAGTRVYTWKATEQPVTFSGIGFRRVSELSDIDSINLLRRGASGLLSPRQKEGYVMDNDDFHNDSRVLPIGIQLGESLNLEFFNLKFDPPKCIEISIPWKEIIDIPTLFTLNDPMRKVVKRRFSLGPKPSQEITVARFETSPSPMITLRVTYERLDADKISVREIKLIIRRYLLTLHYMGDDVVLNTI